MPSTDIEIIEVHDESEWRDHFAKARRKFMTQTWAFGEAKRATNWRPRRLFFKSDGETLAICQVLHKLVAGVPVAARINCGPLFLSGDAERSAEILRAIRSHWRFLFRSVLLIAPSLTHCDENEGMLRGIGFRMWRKYRWSSSQLDLTRSAQGLRTSLESKWRNQLKKSEQVGLQFQSGNSLQDAEWIIGRHAQFVQEKGFEGPTAAFLLALYRASPTEFNVYRAAYNGKDVAGIVAYRFCDVAHYYIGWNGSEGRRLNAGNFLLWNATLDLKRQGCARFDLGGHGLRASSGFSGFKLGMKGDQYQLVGEFFCL